ncbi:MAG: hypothetical protein KDD11_19705 [Acidobacteria bacterium]|nr:hypothetical protein [Acidobacteriota bacterium]
MIRRSNLIGWTLLALSWSLDALPALAPSTRTESRSAITAPTDQPGTSGDFGAGTDPDG